MKDQSDLKDTDGFRLDFVMNVKFVYYLTIKNLM
jgi:hypothetical protein